MAADLSSYKPNEILAKWLAIAAVDGVLRALQNISGTELALELSTDGVNATGFLTKAGVEVLVETLARDSIFAGSAANAAEALALDVNQFPARSSTGHLEAKDITDFALQLLAEANATAALKRLGLLTTDGHLVFQGFRAKTDGTVWIKHGSNWRQIKFVGSGDATTIDFGTTEAV